MIFTKELTIRIDPVLQQILSCNFVQELSRGTLSFNAFAHYLRQDILYLAQDNEALMLLAGKSPDEEQRVFFQKLANDGINMEKALHNDFLSHFNVAEATEQSKAFKAYGEFLLHHAKNSSYEVAAAALLPCFWIYTLIGQHITANNVCCNKYQKFIDTYAGDEYIQYTNQYIHIVESLAAHVSHEVKQQMSDVFLQGSEFELNVFIEAYSVA